jgi:mono/diheme cytochrome c family protein
MPLGAGTGRRPAAISLALALSLGFSATVSAAAAPSDEIVARGRYLAVAGDCAGCHTAPNGGAAFAGGSVIGSPLGAIVSSNITPSRSAGIGGWSEAQFAAALRQGRRADGAYLYPAMPYAAYTALSDADVAALYAYFMGSVAAVDTAPPPTQLPFPFGIRPSMAIWNTLYLSDQRFTPTAGKDPVWNRGAYLANALEHCGACHTPRTLLMGEDKDRAFAGGPVGAWYAPNITSDPVSGIGGWSRADLIAYLKTGRAEGKNRAGGGMAEAVSHSLQYLEETDIEALATYVAAIPPIRDKGQTIPDFGYGSAAAATPLLRGIGNPIVAAESPDGAALYAGACATCHEPTGGGSRNQALPALVHDTTTGAIRPDNLVATILYGINRRTGSDWAFMPSFGGRESVQPLTDPEIAAVANFVLTHFGDPAVRVTPDAVATARRGGATSPLLLITRIGLLTLVVIVVIGLGWWVWRRRQS